MYQTNEPIFFNIYMSSSSRDIFNDKNRRAGRCLKYCRFNFFNSNNWLIFCKRQGVQTLKSGVINLYQNKIPIYEIMSGASIALAALFLIIPGFFTDFFGFLLLIPFTRGLFFNLAFKDKTKVNIKSQDKTIDGEIIENKKDEL